VTSGWSAFIPSVSVSAQATRQFPTGQLTRVENGQVIILSPTPWSHSASLNASVALFEGGRRLFELRRARAGLSAAEASQEWQQYLVDLNVKQRFFDVLAARESEAAALAQLEQARQQLRTAVFRLRAATATKSDSLRSEIQVRNGETAVLQARTDLSTAIAALTRAIGITELVTASPDEDVLETLSVDEATLKQWVDAGPSVQVAEAELAAAQASRTSTFTDYVPSISASYSRSMSRDGFFFEGDPSSNGSFRLAANWPLFNQWNREAQVARTGAALENARATLRDTRLAVRENLIRILGEFRAAEERVQAQTISVDAAEEDLRVQEQRYTLGEGTLLDVLASQTQINEARAQLIRARYDQRIALAQLEALVARDL
jgi:outer membrane protein